jgi:SAM-dependent methyltransferase
MRRSLWGGREPRIATLELFSDLSVWGDCWTQVALRERFSTQRLMRAGVGVEPAQVLCAKAKQLLAGRGDVLCVALQQADIPPATFDALTLWDVLEHVPDPLGFMRHCASLLKPGGFLFANVPDLDSLQSRFMGERWPLLLAEHLNYFNRSSLKLCGERANLKLLEFGRRPASFTLDYVFYRLAQHKVPGAAIGHGVVRRSLLGKICIPVFLGESYGVWTRPISQ